MLKSQVNQRCQDKFRAPPTFIVQRSLVNPGPDHEPNFDCILMLPDQTEFVANAVAGSKLAAEETAAKLAIKHLNELKEQPEARGRHKTASARAKELKQRRGQEVEVMHVANGVARAWSRPSEPPLMVSLEGSLALEMVTGQKLYVHVGEAPTWK